ncbi:MAG: hypothetical protein JXB29_00970 [Sedimentisphaerales bacterium]|nr:hypothetical protein [Sedimentisphaerales bacterium]
MSARLSRTIYGLVVLAVFAFVGCQQNSRGKQVIYEPLTDPNFVVPDYAMEVIDATGGRTAWAKAKKLQLDCVLTVYTSDGGFYLTEQHHEICPWLRLVRIVGTEPEGELTWQLSPEGFSALKGVRRINAFPADVGAEDFAEAILIAMTIPADLLDKNVGAPAAFIKGKQPIRIEGHWYYPIHRLAGSVGAFASEVIDSSKIVYYQSLDNSLVEVILLPRDEKTKPLVVRVYDYREAEKSNILLPGKIEIFHGNPAYLKMHTASEGEPGAFLQERIFTIDYHSIKVSVY